MFHIDFCVILIAFARRDASFSNTYIFSIQSSDKKRENCVTLFGKLALLSLTGKTTAVVDREGSSDSNVCTRNFTLSASREDHRHPLSLKVETRSAG